jgi:dipeptidase E
MSTEKHRLLLFSCGQKVILDKYRNQVFGEGTDISKLKCVCIPTAANPYPNDQKDWQVDEINIFRDFGLPLEILDLAQADAEQTHETLKDADVIYVTGGNTYFLLEHMKRTKFVDILQQRLDQGALYIGCSAGGIVVGPDI